jgi:tRNA nucleotidyltransferase (CCA-adding enzyme)
MAKALVNLKTKLILDPEKKYKKKSEISLEINESKMQSPVVLIDPTWKERNVLAALNNESFQKFQEALRKFLKNPSMEFFKDKTTANKNELIVFAKKNKAELIELELETDRQEGDIAGTKLKKFYNFLKKEFEGNFSVLKSEFYYSEGKSAEIYFVLLSKGKKIVRGPFTNLKENCKAFINEHKNIFEKDGRLYANEKIDKNAKNFFEDYKKANAKKIAEMGITKIVIR